jgi:hypothetical protein
VFLFIFHFWSAAMNLHQLFVDNTPALRSYIAQFAPHRVDDVLATVAEQLETDEFAHNLGCLYRMAFDATLEGRQPVWNAETVKWIQLSMYYDDVGFGRESTVEEVARFLAVNMSEMESDRDNDPDDRAFEPAYYAIDITKVDWLAVATVLRQATKSFWFLEDVLKVA